jgi:hypothetical protein
MTNDPASPLYYGYNFYHVPTDFEYVGIKSEIGGWTIDDKVYTLRSDPHGRAQRVADPHGRLLAKAVARDRI